jgi:hypothetical protein
LIFLPVPVALIYQQPDLLRLPELTANLRTFLPKLQERMKTQGGYTLMQVIAPKGEFGPANLVWSSPGRTDLEMRLLWPRDISNTTERLYLSTEESKAIAQELDASMRTKEFKVTRLTSKQIRLENATNVLSDKPEKIIQEIESLFATAKKYDSSVPDANLSDLKDLPLTANQKVVFSALEKSGYKRVRVTSDGGEDQKYVTLDPPGGDFKIFAYVSPRKMRLQRSLDVLDTQAQALARSGPVLAQFPGMTGKVYDLLGRISVTLELALSDSETTPTRASDSIATLGRGIALLEKPAAPAPVPTDPVGATLKASGLIYTDIGGFYKLQYDYSDTKRKQFGYIRKDIYDYNSLKVQEIFSQCYDSPDAPSVELLQKVFLKRFTVGGLVLEAPSATQMNWRIRFKIDAPTDIAPDRLKEYINLAVGTADEIEKELSTEDKL